MKPYLSLFLFLLALGLLVACVPVTAPTAGIANPASENCVAQGGTLEIRQGQGGEMGYCVFADGSECEEWALMRKECAPGPNLPNPASENCVAQGGTLEIRQGEGGEVGYCVFADGSECEEWALMRKECAPGPNLPNLASENCVAQGGTLEIRQGEGGEVGYCVFADGSECEEWALMRKECAPGQNQTTFADPFAYCAAIGTIDAPDARYTGEQPPPAVIAGIRAAFNAPADAPADLYKEGTFWRCADGQVKACFVGANLPCGEKADLSETPNEGTVSFCKENPNAEVVPAAATGRATVFTWRCVNGTPEKGDQVVQADAQGFIADFWYVIDPSTTTTDTATGPYMPLPADACETLKADAEQALGVAFTLAEAPFLDYLSQEGGNGCQLTASGTGANFSDPMAVVDALKAAFVGWEENPQYAAGGPTGAGIGMTRDAGLLLISAEWMPDAAANCPTDQPISACKLTPEQQLYTVTVQAAMK